MQIYNGSQAAAPVSVHPLPPSLLPLRATTSASYVSSSILLHVYITQIFRFLLFSQTHSIYLILFFDVFTLQ